MGQINLAFTSKKIDPRDHILSVLIEADSFVYGVFDKKHNLVAAGDHIINMHSEDPLVEIKANRHINADYYKRLVIYSTAEFAHLSKLDFGGGDFDAYFTTMSVGDEILSDKFTDSNVHVVFSVNSDIRAKLNELINPDSELHISTALRQYIYPSKSQRNVLLVGSDRMHYMAYAGGDLILYNAYNYRTKEDFLYYLQLATDFTGIDREVDIIEVGGWLGEDSDIYKAIVPYYRHMEWVRLPFVGIDSSDESHLKHHYFSLYAGLLCV